MGREATSLNQVRNNGAWPRVGATEERVCRMGAYVIHMCITQS